LTAIVVIAVIALLVREPGRGDSLGKRLGEDVNQAFGK
jgi:hypothetical protein